MQYRIFAILSLSAATLSFAADAKPSAPAGVSIDQPTPADNLDYGPALSSTVFSNFPKDNVTVKGVTVKLGKVTTLGQEQDATLCFDTQLLRVSAASTGGFLHLNNIVFTGEPGPSPTLAGKFRFGTRNQLAWAQPGDSFVDPRIALRGEPFGGMPRTYLSYRGFYRSGDQVVFSYEVNGMSVLDRPWIRQGATEPAFAHTYSFGPSDQKQTMVIADIDDPGATAGADAARPLAWIETGDSVTAAGLIRPPVGAHVLTAKSADGASLQLRMVLDPHTLPMKFEMAVWNGPKSALPEMYRLLKLGVMDAALLTHGGPAHWPDAIKGEAALAVEPKKSAYVVDEISPPKLPANWPPIRFAALDFFPDGRSAALCTFNGDVYRVDGIDERLDHLTWRRIAAGLFQPLGLKIIDGVIHVHGRDQITALHDLNGKGEIDFYECVNNDEAATDHYREYSTGLESDRDGNLYVIKSGGFERDGQGLQLPITRHHGALMKIGPHGKSLDTVATGFGDPNGLAVRADGQAVAADNHGPWTPVNRLNWIRQDEFCGTVETAHRAPAPTSPDLPLCWLISPGWDTACGEPFFVASEKWGQPRGELFYLSRGRGSLMHIFTEEVSGQMQGGAVLLPLNLQPGAMRARFNPRDGQLYICGFPQSADASAKPTCFQRVRYVGAKTYLPAKLHFKDNGIEITFDQPLDKKTVENNSAWNVEQWNYRWTKLADSKEYKVSDPNQPGHDPVELKAAHLSDDGKTVFLELVDLTPVMQMLIRGTQIRAADGTPVEIEIANTLNVVRGKKMVITSGKVEAR